MKPTRCTHNYSVRLRTRKCFSNIRKNKYVLRFYLNLSYFYHFVPKQPTTKDGLRGPILDETNYRASGFSMKFVLPSISTRTSSSASTIIDISAYRKKHKTAAILIFHFCSPTVQSTRRIPKNSGRFAKNIMLISAGQHPLRNFTMRSLLTPIAWMNMAQCLKSDQDQSAFTDRKLSDTSLISQLTNDLVTNAEFQFQSLICLHASPKSAN